MYLFVYIPEHFIRLGGVDPHGTDSQGIILDIAVEGRENGTVHVFAVFQTDIGTGPVNGHFKHVVIIVEHDVNQGAAALRNGFFHYFFEFCPVHIQ